MEVLYTASRLELTGVAETAGDALAAFELHHPDVVVLDLALTEGNGLEVLREIKRRIPSCRVAVFTVYDAETYRARCAAAGADYFFSKTRQQQELIQFLQTLGPDTRG